MVITQGVVRMALTATTFFGGLNDGISPRAEDEFFGALKVGNSTFKLTATGRFAELDDGLLAGIARFSSRLDQVLDIGASSGVTTLDLHDRLKAAGQGVRVTATDLEIDAYIVPVSPGCRVLVDGHGHVLQYDLFGRALKPWRRRLDWFSGMILVRGLAKRLLGNRASRMIQTSGPSAARRVTLVSPRLRGHEAIRVMQDDILTLNADFIGRFDLVRAANILNVDYFEPADLRRGLDNVLAYMSGPGAWLLLGRTRPRSGHHATLFRMDRCGRLAVIRRFGAGSEVEVLALEANDRRQAHAA
jgi:hypothetical protein